MNEDLNTIWKLYSESIDNATDNLIRNDSEKIDDIWQVYSESYSTGVITEARGALLDTYPEDDYTVYERVRSLEEAREFVRTFFSDKRMKKDLRSEFNELLKADFYRWTDGKTHEDGIDPNEYEAIDNYLSKIGGSRGDMRFKDKENYFSFGYPLVTTKGDFNVDVTYVIPKASAEDGLDFNTINRKNWYSAIEEWVNNIEPLYIIGIKDPKKVADTQSNLDNY